MSALNASPREPETDTASGRIASEHGTLASPFTSSNRWTRMTCGGPSPAPERHELTNAPLSYTPPGRMKSTSPTMPFFCVSSMSKILR